MGDAANSALERTLQWRLHFTLSSAGSCGWQWLFLVGASFWQYCFSTLGLKLSYSSFKGMPLWQNSWVLHLGWNMVQEGWGVDSYICTSYLDIINVIWFYFAYSMFSCSSTLLLLSPMPLQKEPVSWDLPFHPFSSTQAQKILQREDFYKEGGKSLADVSQRSGGCPVPGWVQPSLKASKALSKLF